MIALLVAQQGIDNPEPNNGDPLGTRPSTGGPGHRAELLQVLRLRYQPEGLFFPPSVGPAPRLGRPHHRGST